MPYEIRGYIHYREYEMDTDTEGGTMGKFRMTTRKRENQKQTDHKFIQSFTSVLNR